ncbi:hypothetical protein CR513_02264, partial [Mucuna pruriens]
MSSPCVKDTNFFGTCNLFAFEKAQYKKSQLIALVDTLTMISDDVLPKKHLYVVLERPPKE